MPFLNTRVRVTPVSTSWAAMVTSMYHHAQMPRKIYHTDQNPCEIVTQCTPVKMFALLHCDFIGYRKKWTTAIICHLNILCFSSGAGCMCVCMFMCMGTCVHRPEVDAGRLFFFFFKSVSIVFSEHEGAYHWGWIDQAVSSQDPFLSPFPALGIYRPDFLHRPEN